MPSSEKTSLTDDKPARVYYVHDTHPFYSYRRRQRMRLRCLAYTLVAAIFTMALIVAVSYSVSHDIVDSSPNLTSLSSQVPANFSTMKLGFSPGSGSYTLFTNPATLPTSNSILVTDNTAGPPTLTEDEYKEGLEAGRQAMNERLFADATALMSPLPSPSPESRHRYAVSTCASVGTLALSAIGELAATRKIENSRTILSEPSAFGSFFDGGWSPSGVCKHLDVPKCVASKYRSFDGSCNRPMQRGATMMPFKRLLPPSYADGIQVPRRAISGRDLPSAREVSLKVHKPSPSTNQDFTVMLAVYGQFLDHDITATAISQGVNGTSISCCPPSVGHPECFPVPVAAGDPVFDVSGRTCMDFVRSAPAPQCRLGPRQQLNQVTAFIDGSAIYGSDLSSARELREFAGGRLRMQVTPDNRTLLPASTNPKDGCNRETERLRGRYCFAAGDPRANENLHLTTMHLLWARQHNRVVEKLAKINPEWDDETLYEEARRVVAAQLQHITYQEFIPIVLGEQETNLRDLRPLKSGYRQWTEDPDGTGTDPTIANNFAAAAFRFAHTLLPGLMKVTNEQQGTSSYVELHRILFNPYMLYVEGGVKSSVTSATRNVIQMTSTHVTSQLTSHLFEDPTANATVPCGLDLVSLNIQRGRDHGLPGYTRWREHCGLGRPESFSDLEGHLDPQTLEDISTLYASVHDVDLYTGALAELPKAGGIVGPTFSCLIADQFVRLQKGDRFWYEIAGQPHSFAEDQLQELRKTSLARIICDCSDGVTQTQAQVMRAIGPKNPMMSCEDIPIVSFEAWKEGRPVNPVLRASFMPANWTDFKSSINSTIQDVVTFINDTRASVTVDTDWVAFKNYINNTFSDLRNQVSGLHPPKTVESPVPNEKSPWNPDSFILRSAGPASAYQDWLSFKSNIVKSLNDSIGTMGGGPAAAGKWKTFKQDITDQFADLKDQIASIKADLAPKLMLKQELSNQSDKLKESTIPAIFDWKNFKDNVISSLDDAIGDVASNMPPPGDPAWATFSDDMKDRFSAFKDKIDSQRPTVATELAAGGPGSVDWLAYKTDVIKTVNDAVKKIKDGMPPPGDPAWTTYRDEVMKSFSAFKSTPSPLELATLSTASANTAPRAGNMGAPFAGKFSNSELSNLTNDWLEFRTQINGTLAGIIQDIQSRKPTTIDPVGWAAFKDSTMNDFAKLKDEIAAAKAEWVAEASKPKPNQDSPTLKASKKGGGPAGASKFDYTVFTKPVIPPDEWIAFKKQINDTVMNLLNSANATDRIDVDKVHGMFNESFYELKSEIASLKSLIAESSSKGWNKSAAWVDFQTQLNSTVKGLVDGLKNQTRPTDAVKALFQARDSLSTLEPPTNATGVSPVDWVQYISRLNTTVTETLKGVGGLRRAALMMKSEEPMSSASNKPLPEWLIVPFLASVLQILPSASKFRIPAVR
ncbi:uncharacterized protein LOC143373634 isoform X2 [Andrena cerasifolii]|uniref:uncharacterized protein LOC143373634 isoform X2 n=1 Tax=Andrena cerasifolii TaxID=2819439 RepID=UPI0040380131